MLPVPKERLVRVSLVVRRVVRGGRGLLLVLALGGWVATGRATAPFSPVSALVACAWAALLGVRLRDKLLRRAGRSGIAPLRVDLELGALLSVGLDAGLLRWGGGLSGPFSPAVYVLVA